MSLKAACAFLCLAVSFSPGLARAETSKPERVAAEADHRRDGLIADGYKLTHGWNLTAPSEKTTFRFEFVVPKASDSTISFWAELDRGELSFRLSAPDGSVKAAWSGRKGETTVLVDASAGNYRVEIEQPAGTKGRALLGVKGEVLARCKLNGFSVQEHAANPSKGFFWPYLMFLPREVTAGRLLVIPNNTGFETEDVVLLRVSGVCEIRAHSSLATRLGVPLLVPLFPRPAAIDADKSVYLHALTRSSLETKADTFRRVDLQLLAMMDDAAAALRDLHVDTEPKVLMFGFSAAGSFVNRFSMLHPERVAAVAVGSPGGWPLAPVDEFAGERLSYPVGVADLQGLVGRPLDLLGVKQVSWFFFMGGEDKNDAVVFRDSFSKAQEQLIFRRFGETPVSRWKMAERLYSKAGINARFSLYPGAAHAVTQDMERDVTAFFEKAGQAASR